MSDYYYDQAMQFIQREPGRFLSLMLLKARLFWTKWELSNSRDIYFWTEKTTPMVGWLPLGFGLVGPLGLVGLVLALRRPMESFPLWGFVLTYMASVVLFFCTARYRMPVVPVLILLLGAYACVEVIRAVARSDWKPILIGSVVVFPAVALVHWTPKDKALRNDAFEYMRIGAAYDRQKRPQEAEEAYRTALRIAPGYFSARVNLARLLLRTGRDDEAIEQLRLAVGDTSNRLTGETVEKIADAHFTLGAALAEKGAYAEAVEHYRRAMALDPNGNPGRVQFNLAMVLERLGRNDEAAAAFAEAIDPLQRQLATSPEDGQVLYALGRSVLAHGRFAEAADYLERCLAVSPDHAPARELLDRAQSQTGRGP